MTKEIRLEEETEKLEINSDDMQAVLEGISNALKSMTAEEFEKALDNETKQYRQDNKINFDI